MHSTKSECYINSWQPTRAHTHIGRELGNHRVRSFPYCQIICHVRPCYFISTFISKHIPPRGGNCSPTVSEPFSANTLPENHYVGKAEVEELPPNTTTPLRCEIKASSMEELEDEELVDMFMAKLSHCSETEQEMVKTA